jgi:Transposase DDE domain
LLYSTNYLIDLHAGIIMDVEATPANRAEEVASTKTMIDRVEQRFAMKPRRLVGDTAYGTASMLGWMVNEKQIAPHVPVWERPGVTARSRERSSAGMSNATSINAPLDTRCAVTGGHMQTRVHTLRRPTPSSIARVSQTAADVR